MEGLAESYLFTVRFNQSPTHYLTQVQIPNDSKHLNDLNVFVKSMSKLYNHPGFANVESFYVGNTAKISEAREGHPIS